MSGVKHYVLNEEALGLIREKTPMRFEILFWPGRSPLDSFAAVPQDRSKLRPATKADFDRFRVDWKGHLEG